VRSGPDVISDLDAAGSEERDEGGAGVVEGVVSAPIDPDRQAVEATLASGLEDVVSGEIGRVVERDGSAGALALVQGGRVAADGAELARPQSGEVESAVAAH